MEESIICHLPAIGEMTHNHSACSPVVSRRESHEQIEHVMLDMAYDYGYCHIALIRKSTKPTDVFSELPDCILVKNREFKKDLERVVVKDIDGFQVPFAIYTAVDNRVGKGPAFIWLKRSQVRPTRVLTMKY